MPVNFWFKLLNLNYIWFNYACSDFSFLATLGVFFCSVGGLLLGYC